MRSSSRHPFLGSDHQCREYAADLRYRTLMRTFLLKLGATVLTLGTTLASALYVTAHLKNSSAPLQPSVAATRQGFDVGALTVTPGVRHAAAPPLPSTHPSSTHRPRP